MDTMDHHLTALCDTKTARHVQHKKTQRALDALKTLACQRIRHLDHAHVTKDGLVTHQTVFHVVQIVNPVWEPESQTAKPVLQTQHSLQIKVLVSEYAQLMDFMALHKIVCLAIVFVNNVLEDLIQNVRSDTMILTY